MADKVSLATLALAKAYTDERGGGGGGGTDNYNDLTHKPTVNGVEFKGTMTGETLGLVDAETGKGLSANDYTDADKSIVGGVTSALAGKVDKVSGKGLSTNDYSNADKSVVDGVTTALDGKVDKVSGKGLSTNDYSDADKTIVDGVTSALEGKTDLDVVAEEFSSSTLYGKNSYVIYNGELYQFKAQHNPSAWIGTDATKITVGSALLGKSDYFTLSGKLVWDEDFVTHEKILHGSYTPTVTANNENPVTSKGVYNFAFPRDEQAVLGAKNLLAYPYNGGKNENGVTFTNNGDGTITVNGTATSYSDYSFHNRTANPLNLPAGKYYISGGISPAINIVVGRTYNGSFQELAVSTGTDAEFTVTEGDNLGISLRVNQNAVASNIIVKPMIRLATDPDDTYVPYAMTNRELTLALDDKADKTQLDEWSATSIVQSDNTVTFTGLNDAYGYDLFCNDKLIGISATRITIEEITVSAVYVTITYTVTGAASGDVCKLRILK